MPQLRPLTQEELAPVATPPAQKQQPGMQWGRFLKNPGNELRYWGKVLLQEPRNTVRSIRRLDQGYQSLGFQRKGETLYRAPNGRLVGNTPSQRNAQQGSIRAITQPLQYLEGVGGQTARRAIVDASAKALQVPKEEDLVTNPDARRAQGFGMFVTETGVASLAAGALGSVAGPVAAQAQARLAPVASKLPAWMQSALRASKAPAKWGAAVAAEEGITSLMGDPYRNGSPADWFPDNPLQVQPGDNIWQAAARTFPGNIAAGAVVGGTLELGVDLAARGIKSLLPNTSRRTREVKAQQEVQEARDWSEQNGLQAKNEDGTYEFTPQEDSAPARKTLDGIGAEYTEATTGIPTAPMEPGGAVLEGKLPEADPKVDPWNPEVPEVDTLVRGADQLDDEALGRVVQSEGMNEAVEAELAVKPEIAPVDVATASAPSGKLAQPITPYVEQFEAFPNNQLLSLAHPDNSEQLFQKVSVMTGKDFDEFTRKDVLAGLKALAETEGIQIIPSRVDPQGLAIVDVNAIEVDPARFQFKQGISDNGVQKGQSLSGLERWNTDLEDVLDVWQDPADGKLYVVNGHNRLAKAKEMGIPSLRVNFLTARTAEQARAMGAIKNIGQGAGTAFDAAKFIREKGFETPEQLKQAGLPLKSGLADAGFALSKLPPNLFDDAVAGRLPLNQAITLGKSGLDPEQMGRLMNSLSGRSISDAQLAEMVDMARTAPTVASDQMGLFGAETLDTIEIKADLAARVRAELIGNKNLFKKVSKDKAANKLEGVGTQVDRGKTQEAAAAAEAALGNFDAQKYAEGTALSQILNQATEDVANGAKPNVVAQRIAQQVADASKGMEAPAPKAVDEDGVPIEPRAPQSFDERYGNSPPERLAQFRQEADKYLLTDRKRKNREKLAAEYKANEELVVTYIKEIPGSNEPEEMAEEAFMAKWGPEETHPQVYPKSGKHAKAIEELDRDAWARKYIEWYDNRPGSTLTAAGRNELKKEIVKKAIKNKEVRPSATEIPPTDSGSNAPSLEDLSKDPQAAFGEELRLAEEYAARDAFVENETARKAREDEGFYEQSLEEQLDNGLMEKFPDGEPEELVEPQAPAYQLPTDVVKSKPRYGLATLQFSNDLDRAAYIIRSSAKKSKGEDRIIASLEAQGLDVAAVRKHGEWVKSAIGKKVEEMTGSRRAPQESMTIEVGEVPFDAARTSQPLMSVAPAAGPKGWDQVEGIAPLRTPEQARKLIAAMEKEVKRVTGHDMGDRFSGHFGESPPISIPEVHGGRAGETGTAAGWYQSVEDVMEVFDLLHTPRNTLLETMWHESWHRLQFQFLTRKEMAVLNTAFARAKIDDLVPLSERLSNKASIERQAYAFQTYARLRRLSRESKAGAIPEAQKEAVKLVSLVVDNVETVTGLTRRDYIELKKALGRPAANIWEKFMSRLFNVWEAATNFVNGRGWQTLEDVYERAYSGRMASRRKIYDAKRLLRDITTENPKLKNALMKRMVNRFVDREARDGFLELWAIDNDPVKLAEFLDTADKELWFNSEALMKTAAMEGC